MIDEEKELPDDRIDHKNVSQNWKFLCINDYVIIKNPSASYLFLKSLSLNYQFYPIVLETRGILTIACLLIIILNAFTH